MLAITLPEVAQHCGRQAANPTLHQNVGEWTGCSLRLGFQQFVGDDAVPLHHVARNFLITFIRGVGDNPPAIDPCQTRSFLHRRIVIADNTNDARAERRNRRLALHAHLRVQHDHAAAAHALRRCRQGPAMVAVGRADRDEVLQGIGVPSREQIVRFPGLVRPLAKDQAQQGNRRAQHLEAAQWGAFRFVLDMDLPHRQLRSQARQTQRRCTATLQ